MARRCEEILEEFSTHKQGPADDGNVVSVSNLKSTMKTFLGRIFFLFRDSSVSTQLATSA